MEAGRVQESCGGVFTEHVRKEEFSVSLALLNPANRASFRTLNLSSRIVTEHKSASPQSNQADDLLQASKKQKSLFVHQEPLTTGRIACATHSIRREFLPASGCRRRVGSSKRDPKGLRRPLQIRFCLLGGPQKASIPDPPRIHQLFLRAVFGGLLGFLTSDAASVFKKVPKLRSETVSDVLGVRPSATTFPRRSAHVSDRTCCIRTSRFWSCL